MKVFKSLFLTALITMFTAAQVFAGSTPPPEPPPVDPPANAMFDNYIALGDSLTQGFQSGGVDETRQPGSFPSRLAGLMGTGFVEGLLEFPGYMANLEDYEKGNISFWSYGSIAAGTTGYRIDDYADQARLGNFGITGADIATIQDTDGSEGGFYGRVLGWEGAPALDQALDRNPTFMTLFLGNNDNLGAALSLDTSLITDYEIFKQKFEQLVSRVAAKSSIQGVAIATLPDASAIPYLKAVTNPDLPAGSVQPFWADDATTEEEVLTPAQVMVLKEKVAKFNNLIKETAAANGWAIFDSNEFFNDVKEFGYYLKDKNGDETGRYMTADYLGGLFSLDGVHMNITGYAVAANCFAEAIDQTYGSDLGFIDEYEASNNDSLYTDPCDIRYMFSDSWYSGIIQSMISSFM